MAGNKTFTELTTLATVDKDNDWMAVVDVSDTSASTYGTTKKANVAQFVGEKGDAATVDVGTTTTGVAGSNANVVNVGTTSAAVLDFTIPRGDKGEKGDKGIQGPQGVAGEDGEDAYVYIAYASDSSGTGFTTTFNANLDYIAIKSTTTPIATPQASDFTGLWKNYKGIQGIQGEQGVAGEDGSSAYVYIAYASDANGTGFTTTFDASLDYIAIKATTSPIASPQASDFTGLWKNYKGEKGDKGDTGAAGADGEDGLDINWKGTYSSGTAYVVNDAVFYEGSSYICILNSTGNLPTNTTYWNLMAQKGAAGEGSGDVSGPSSATDNAVARFDSITGKLIQDSLVTINDSGSVNIPAGQSYLVNGTPVSGYSDEQAQDAVAGMIADTDTVDFTYTDATPELKADVKDASITNAKLANMATKTYKGRTSATTGSPEDVSVATLKSDLSLTKADVGLENVDNAQQIPSSYLDTDGTLTANSDTKVASQKATKTYADTKIPKFADPNADRLVFWDDSATAFGALTPSTGLTITNTDMTVRGASTTQTGIVELATTAETETGTDTTRAVTPDALHDMTTLAGASWMLDEDNMASNSAVKVPSQQSTKAYADTKLAKATNVTVINDTGIADGEVAVFNLTNKDIRTSDKTIVTTLGADDTTLPTSKAVADAISTSGGYTDEEAQDAVGSILTDSSEIDFTYNDTTPSITASIKAGSIDETKLDTSVNASLDLADSAIQSTDLATVATTGSYSDLSGTPDLTTKLDKATNVTAINDTGIADGEIAVFNLTNKDIRTSDKTLPSGAVVGTTDTQALSNKTLTSPVINTGVSGTAILDEDNMASDSATKLATQQSIKAYVDSKGYTWKGEWVTSTAYAVNDTIQQGGSGYVCVTAHTSGTFSTDLSAGKWELFVEGTDKTMPTGDIVGTTDTQTLTNKTIDGNSNTISNAIPAGVIEMFGGSTAPTGYLLCDGSAVSRTTYSKLFTAIGTTYGSGDGSTTFNVPNLKGKVAVGKDSADTSFDALGETGGEKTHTLTVTEMPSHRHTYQLPNNSDPNFMTGGGIYNVKVADTTSQNTSSTGGGGSHNNLQPYIVLNYIIKT